MTQSELDEQVNLFLNEGQYLSAQPFMLELISRFEQEPETYTEALEGLYFFTGISYLQQFGVTPTQEALKSAIEWLEKLHAQYPAGENAVVATLALGDAYRALQEHDKSIEAYKRVLERPLADNASYEQRKQATTNLATAYYYQRKWAEGIPWLRQQLDMAGDENERVTAAAQLMEAYLYEKRFEDAFDMLRFLGAESPARYNVRFNLALLEAGDQLYNEGQLKDAMLVYRLVFSKEELLQWQTALLVMLEERLAYFQGIDSEIANDLATELQTQVANTRIQVEAIGQIPPYSENLQARISRNYVQTGRMWEAYWSYRDLVERYERSNAIEDYYYAAFSVALQLDLFDEAEHLGRNYLLNNNWFNYRSDISLQMCQVLLNKGEYDEVIARGTTYIESAPEDRAAPQIIYLMGGAYIRSNALLDMENQFISWMEAHPDTPMEQALFYWVGLSTLFRGHYDAARDYFTRVLEQYPTGNYAEEALYRRGVSFFGLEEMELATADFNNFVQKYPDSGLRGEVEYFLGDIAASEGQVLLALNHYRKVEEFTDNISYIQNAYFQAGDLMEANELYDRMVENYTRFIDNYTTEGDLSAAVYQLGRAWKLLDRPDKMMSVYINAIATYGNDPEQYGMDKILTAYLELYGSTLNEINATIEFLNRVYNEADFRQRLIEDRQYLFSYLEDNPAIDDKIERLFYTRRFRESLKRSLEPVEERINFYFDLREKYPANPPQETLSTVYQRAHDAGQRTLALRLHKALDEAGSDPAPNAVFTEDDFAASSPSTLLWMAQRIADYDENMALEAYAYLIDNFPTADSLMGAYLQRGDLYLRTEQLELALEDFKKAEELFPARPEVKRAAMRQGDINFALGRYEEARDKFLQITNVREWRGVAHAEALLKTGLTFLEEADYARAHAYFERIYIGYAGFPDWATKAYFYAGQTLQRMGKTDDARRTYAECLQTDTYRNAPFYQRVEQAAAQL